MKYAQPKLLELPCAVESIQNGLMKTDVYVDNVDPKHPLNATTPAYDADE